MQSAVRRRLWLAVCCVVHCVKVIIALLPPLALEVHSSEVAMLGQISPLFLLSSLVEVVLVSYVLTTSLNRPTEEELLGAWDIFMPLPICDCESTKRLNSVPC